MKNKNNEKGFVATVSLAMLFLGAMVFTLVMMSSVLAYADSVYRRELRIQASLNADACIDTIKLMVTGNYFLSGEIHVKDFGCVAEVSNDFAGNMSATIIAKLKGVSVSKFLASFHIPEK